MVLLLALLGCPKAPPAPAAPPPPPRPRLAVYLVVDQFPTDLFDRARPLFAGGLARLAGPDAFAGTANYAHAVTMTCPGHATLSTGASPRVHGVIGNDWMVDGKPMYCGDIANLMADTLADRVKDAGGTVVSLSIKDRAALMLGGRTPDVIAWYMKKTGTWCEQAPEWLPIDGVATALQASWEPLHADAYAAQFPDVQPQESAIELLGPTFPHTAPGLENPALFRMLPAAGGLLVDAAIQAIDQVKLGADDTPDLLAIGFSQTDYIGHAFTAQSWEAMDGILRLDQDLGRLLDALDAKLGPDGYAVVLTSDHGAIPGGAFPVDSEALVAAANDAMRGAGLDGEVAFSDPWIWLPAGDEAARDAAARAVAQAVGAREGIEAAYAMKDGIPEDAPGRVAIEQAIWPGRSGDVYVLLDQKSQFTFEGETTGTSHGTPWKHDTEVPLLILARGIPPVHDLPLDARDVAPTIADMLGVERPRNAEGNALIWGVQDIRPD